ncbi:hypothetical protein NDU88_001046 [Pleurodeles waltl]|uniref:Uncharacterized protein n=1 Tax=Pleurodeles waltl TaxID=8319 RepID=A0AAV7N9P4_PLEWA|nr:hypothetical protein NDU88_001046 [Pleurodeles waltl]
MAAKRLCFQEEVKGVGWQPERRLGESEEEMGSGGQPLNKCKPLGGSGAGWAPGTLPLSSEEKERQRSREKTQPGRRALSQLCFQNCECRPSVKVNSRPHLPAR